MAGINTMWGTELNGHSVGRVEITALKTAYHGTCLFIHEAQGPVMVRQKQVRLVATCLWESWSGELGVRETNFLRNVLLLHFLVSFTLFPLLDLGKRKNKKPCADWSAHTLHFFLGCRIFFGGLGKKMVRVDLYQEYWIFTQVGIGDPHHPPKRIP